MSVRKRLSLAVLAGIIMFGGLHLAELLSIPEVQVPTAEAKVGRPCTPVSVAGVARRTARRN
jgi:hypothetical protein